MDYVKKVREIVENCIESRKAFDAAIAEAQRDESLSGKGIADKIMTLKLQRDECIVAAHKALLGLKDEFIAAAEKSNLISGDMNNDDAAIFMSGIELSVSQFEDIANRNKDNPFVLALAHKYIDEHKGFVATLPLSVPQIIANFTDFADRACNMIYEPAESIRLAYFLDERRFNPEGCDRIS